MGAAAAGGGGEGSKATQSGFSLTPLSTPPAPSKRRDPGDHLHSDERGRAVWVPKRGWGLPSPTGESPRHAENRVAGARGTHTHARPHVHPPQTWTGDSGRVLSNTLPPPPQTLESYLPEGWRSVSKPLPETAPSTPLDSLREGKRQAGLWAAPGPPPPLLLLCET